MFVMQRFASICLLALMLATATTALAEQRPTLVVNIVVGSMRANDLDRYSHNFTEQGIRRLIESGVRYEEAYYNFSALSTASGLATLATGANPSVHGIIGSRWYSPTDAKPISLIADSKAFPVEFSTGAGNYSPHRLTAPSYGDALLSDSHVSKQYTIAVEALSAIVLNGRRGVALWAEKNQTFWTTSSAYCDKLPEWIVAYTKRAANGMQSLNRWTPIY